MVGQAPPDISADNTFTIVRHSLTYRTPTDTEMTIDVNQIVREVIAELERRQAADADAPDASTPTADSAAPKDDPRELVVYSRVVTLAELRDRLSQIRRLVVPPDAVITPAARDALADRNVSLVFGTADTSTAAGAARVLLIAARTGFDPSVLAEALRGEGIGVEMQESDCLIRSTDALAARVRDGRTLAVVLTPDVAAALCLANRHSGVRAVSATEAGAVAAAARGVGANVLVVDPQGRGLFQLKQTIGAFCRPGPWPCPEPLQPRLG